MLCYVLLDGLVSFLGTAETVSRHALFLPMVSLALWVPVEAVLLSAWGTTPGKWCLLTTVRSADGRLLSFRDSLRRALRVWERGLGFGFFYATCLGPYFAYHELTERGLTAWDHEGSHVVSHGHLNPARNFGAAWFLLSTVLIVRMIEKGLMTGWTAGVTLALFVLLSSLAGTLVALARSRKPTPRPASAEGEGDR